VKWDRSPGEGRSEAIPFSHPPLDGVRAEPTHRIKSLLALKKSTAYLVLIVLLFLVPTILRDPRWLHVVIMIYLYIMLAGGLRLIMSTGQVSFAHAAFWAIGAYSSALLVMKLGFSFWVALPSAAVISAIIGILIGYPCLRLKGPYFFIITLAFGEIARLMFTSWVDLFGGANGIAGIPFPDPISVPLLGVIQFGSRSTQYYYLLLLMLLGSLFVMYRLEGSRFGMTCAAIREADELAQSLGISAIRYKLILFVTACFLAGLAGSFYAHYLTYISPDFFTFWESMIFLLIAAIGGSGSTSGVILGAILLTLVPEVAREAKRVEPIIFGGILVLVLLFLPGGLWSLKEKIPWKLLNLKTTGRG
jgi:branched-chain amino acid transport system permease protein